MNDVFKSLTGAIVGGALTLLATVGVGALGFFNKDRELDIEMVKISLTILGGETGPAFQESRQFAINLLEQYAPDGMSPSNGTKVKGDAWMKSGTVTPIKTGNDVMHRDLEASPQALAAAMAYIRAIDRGEVPQPWGLPYKPNSETPEKLPYQKSPAPQAAPEALPYQKIPAPLTAPELLPAPYKN